MDSITCSPWSPTLRVTTARLDDGRGRIVKRPDASDRCDPARIFDPPVPLAGFDSPNYDEALARASPDELTLYVQNDPVSASNFDIFMAQRTATTAAFGTAMPLTQVNSTANEFDPSVSSDGLTIFFSSGRVPSEGVHIYVSTRTSTLGTFGTPSELAGVNSSVVTDTDSEPYVAADGQELWFASTRAGGLGSLDLYRAVWNGSGFANPVAVAELNSTATELVPTLSADRLTVYLASTRPGGKGGYDIWTSHRSTATDGFPTPTLVSELNTSTNDFPSWLSPDDCRLYLIADTAGTRDIYVATRHPQ